MNIKAFHRLITLSVLSVLTACHAQTPSETQSKENQPSSVVAVTSIQMKRIAEFNEPWALAVLADGRLLITEKSGQLILFNPRDQKKTFIKNLPKVAYGGQGGFGDIVLHPKFEQNHQMYLSYAEAGQGGYGAVVIRADLNLDQAQPQLDNITTIWKQVPKVRGQGHYAHRVLFDGSGKLWISSGERQKFDPAQDLTSNLGKIIRINDDGSVIVDNPFQSQGEVAKQVWSFGHRNPLGMAFDEQGQLWVVEMGPKGGDELNLIQKGKNYGYPVVSNGDHYSGLNIPDHVTRPEFEAPKLDWTPVISPSSLIFYTGQMFPKWQGKAIIGGLSSEALIIVDTTAQPAKEIQRIDMKQRIRGLQQAKDGSIWVIEDGKHADLIQLGKP
ncbi:PQQ-dependent sugar dehydrogenase [Acinetobacter sp. SWAC57]|uniref:PQQ-dependent sugar dehydrogenase n=1 Tax=Acinetobacter sp. SWAC57 TaxID=2293834 RepID=UPI000E5BC4B1|nr:PQQ-dependent sugar dehydrogenase [Acinetobacter sp. SWAC57]RGD89311.1 PQQ-dependent sugar dehydrogenase [Acinetobacter sp. SWAC57]